MKVIERVLYAYGLMVNLTAEQEDAVREQLNKFLRNRTGSEEELAVLALQFLRGASAVTLRRGRKTTKPRSGELVG